MFAEETGSAQTVQIDVRELWLPPISNNDPDPPAGARPSNHPGKQRTAFATNPAPHHEDPTLSSAGSKPQGWTVYMPPLTPHFHPHRTTREPESSIVPQQPTSYATKMPYLLPPFTTINIEELAAAEWASRPPKHTRYINPFLVKRGVSLKGVDFQWSDHLDLLSQRLATEQQREIEHLKTLFVLRMSDHMSHNEITNYRIAFALDTPFQDQIGEYFKAHWLPWRKKSTFSPHVPRRPSEGWRMRPSIPRLRPSERLPAVYNRLAQKNKDRCSGHHSEVKDIEDLNQHAHHTNPPTADKIDHLAKPKPAPKKEVYPREVVEYYEARKNFDDQGDFAETSNRNAHTRVRSSNFGCAPPQTPRPMPSPIRKDRIKTLSQPKKLPPPYTPKPPTTQSGRPSTLPHRTITTSSSETSTKAGNIPLSTHSQKQGHGREKVHANEARKTDTQESTTAPISILTPAPEESLQEQEKTRAADELKTEETILSTAYDHNLASKNPPKYIEQMEPVESIGTEVLVGSEVLKTDMEPSKDESVTEEKDNPITSTANRLSDEILKENRLNEETVASQFDAAIEEQSHMLINSYASAGDGESNQIETAREVSFQPADGVGGYTSEHDVPEAVIAEFVQKGPPGSSEVREEKVAGIEESSPTKNEKMHENNELLAHEDAEATYHPVYVFDEAVDSPVSGDRGLADKAADFPAGPAESENIQADADHPVYAEGIDKNVTERGAIKAEEVTAHAESNSSAYIDIVAAHESAEVNEGEPTEIFDVVPDSVEPHQDAPVEGSETHNLNFVQEENTQLAFVETEGQQVDHEVKQVEEVGQTIDAQARTSEIPEETHKDLDKIEPALGTEIVETGESATNGHGYEDAFDSMENPVKAIPLAGEISEVPKESAAYVLQETNPMAIGDDTPDQNNAEVINKEPEPPLESMVAETGNEDQSKVEAELPGPNAHSSEVPSSESQEANLIDGSNALDLSTGENKPQPIDAAPGGE